MTIAEQKPYKQLNSEYKEAMHDYASLSEKERTSTAKGIKLMRKMKDLRAQIDRMAEETYRRKTPDYSVGR